MVSNSTETDIDDKNFKLIIIIVRLKKKKGSCGCENRYIYVELVKHMGQKETT